MNHSTAASKLPNLLIVGATKCGTSSLHRYLSQHPDIFMSKVKEPRFISSQVTEFPLKGPRDHTVEKWYVKDLPSYEKLFEEAEGYSVRGESSADTLYFHEKTIPVIKRHLGNPRIIIMLRDPVKRAFSAYQHLVRDLREELSFEDGLNQEQQRIRENWELIYHYTAGSHYYDSVKAFQDNFSSVKVVLTEDQNKRPRQMLRDVFRFLEVNPDVDIDTAIRYNMSGKPKSQWLHQFFFEGNLARRIAQPIVRTLLKPEVRARIAHKIQTKNLTRLSIQPDTAKVLRRLFEDDTRKLETLIGRDLSQWREQ